MGRLLFAGLALMQSLLAFAGMVEPVCFEAPRTLDAMLIQKIAQSVTCDLFAYDDTPFKLLPTESDYGGRHTAFWAQEAVGGDLVGPYLDYYDRAHPDSPSQKVDVGVMDAGITPTSLPAARLSGDMKKCAEGSGPCDFRLDEHGTSVANLIVGAPPVGIGPRAMIAKAATALPPPALDWPEYLAQNEPYFSRSVEQMIGDGHPPRVINMSIFMKNAGYTEKADLAMRELSRRSILVHSAGNDYPTPLYDFTKSQPGIVVGSLAPDGLLSDMSQEGAPVTISAPANYEVISITNKDADGGKGFENFKATSGAAALVTAAVSDVQSLLPDISLAEITALMAMTAIKTSGFVDDNGKNGAGSLNAYKMTRVAARLKRGWPGNRGLLAKPDRAASIYDFSEEAAALRDRAIGNLALVPCDQLKQSVAMLRTSFFLNPDDARTRAALGELYRAHGLDAQAQFVGALPPAEAVAALTDPEAKLLLAIRNGVYQPRMAPLFTKIAEPASRRDILRKATEIMHGQAAPMLELAFRDRDPSVRRLVAIELEEVYGKSARCRQLATALTHDSSPAVRAAAVETLNRCRR